MKTYMKIKLPDLVIISKSKYMFDGMNTVQNLSLLRQSKRASKFKFVIFITQSTNTTNLL